MAVDSDRMQLLAGIAVADERERVERILATARETLGMHDPEPGVGGGWGLHIVGQMAGGLTVSRPEAGGSAVSFELDLAGA